VTLTLAMAKSALDQSVSVGNENVCAAASMANRSAKYVTRASPSSPVSRASYPLIFARRQALKCRPSALLSETRRPVTAIPDTPIMMTPAWGLDRTAQSVNVTPATGALGFAHGCGAAVPRAGQPITLIPSPRDLRAPDAQRMSTLRNVIRHAGPRTRRPWLVPVPSAGSRLSMKSSASGSKTTATSETPEITMAAVPGG
jgi:hypothetical protein